MKYLAKIAVACIKLIVFSPLVVNATPKWESKLVGLDLDPSVPGYEAYYDKRTDVTWLTDLGAVKGTGHEWVDDVGIHTALAWWDQAASWTAQLRTGKVPGWRLPTSSEFESMFFKTLGNKTNVLVEPGPFKNFGSCRPESSSAWIGCYVWTGDVLGYQGDHPVIQTFGIDGHGWNTALPQNPMIAWAVHDGRVLENTDCVKRNRLFQGAVSASHLVYSGALASVVDCKQGGGNPSYFNLATTTGWFRVSLAESQCFSYFKLLATMSPSGTMGLRVHLEDAVLQDLHVQDFTQTVVDGEMFTLSLSAQVCGVQSVRFETLSSPSWIGWMEARGF